MDEIEVGPAPAGRILVDGREVEASGVLRAALNSLLCGQVDVLDTTES